LMISSPLDMLPLFSSMPIVWARDGEFGRGGTFGARLFDDWLPCDWASEPPGNWPTGEVGLF
jgi:hypothetical protein